MAPNRGTVDHMLPVIGQSEFDKCFQQCFPNALFCPAPEADIDGVPFAISLMHVTPRTTDPQNVQYPIQKTAVVLGWTGLSPAFSRQKRVNDPPLRIGYISTSQSYLLKGSLELYRS